MGVGHSTFGAEGHSAAQRSEDSETSKRVAQRHSTGETYGQPYSDSFRFARKYRKDNMKIYSKQREGMHGVVEQQCAANPDVRPQCGMDSHVPAVRSGLLSGSDSVNPPFGLKASLEEVSPMMRGLDHKNPYDKILPPTGETRSEKEKIVRLGRAQLAAEIIFQILRGVFKNSESDQKRSLHDISVQLAIVREVTDRIDDKHDDNNFVDKNCDRTSIEVEIRKHIDKFEKLLPFGSGLHFGISDRRLLRHAQKLKDLVNDLSKECRRSSDNRDVVETLTEPTTISTPVMESYPSTPPQKISNLQEVLEKFSNAVIQYSKPQFKTLKLSNADGSKAYALSHFLKIESDILNFQMKTALESLKSEDSVLEKPIFGRITSEISHGNQKIIESHLESMKLAKEEMDLLKSVDTSTASNVITELAFWVLSFQNSNEELMSMGIKPISADLPSFNRQKVNQMLRFLFEIRKYQLIGGEPPHNYAISVSLNEIEMLRVADYSECIGEKKEEAIAGTSS